MPIEDFEFEIKKLRRMIDDVVLTGGNDPKYEDEELFAYMQRYPLLDFAGNEPFIINYNTSPPSKLINPNWNEVYDLNAAAASIWYEKAAELAKDYNFSADGGSFSRSNAFQQAKDMGDKFARRKQPSSLVLIPVGRTPVSGAINLPEED